MAFIESDRVQLRMYLGFSATYLQADPRLESAITNIQAVTDGGTRPDNTSELNAKAIVTKLQAIDLSLDNLALQQGASGVDEISVDPAREMIRLRMQGRMYCHRLARIFDTMPRSDIYATAPQNDAAYPALPFGGRSGY